MPRIRLLVVVAFAALAISSAAGASPGDVLYDQYDNAGTVSTNSQDYEAANNTLDNEAADDFVVSAGPGWIVAGVEVQGMYDNGPAPPPQSTCACMRTAPETCPARWSRSV